MCPMDAVGMMPITALKLMGVGVGGIRPESSTMPAGHAGPLR